MAKFKVTVEYEVEEKNATEAAMLFVVDRKANLLTTLVEEVQ